MATSDPATLNAQSTALKQAFEALRKTDAPEGVRDGEWHIAIRNIVTHLGATAKNTPSTPEQTEAYQDRSHTLPVFIGVLKKYNLHTHAQDIAEKFPEIKPLTALLEGFTALKKTKDPLILKGTELCTQIINLGQYEEAQIKGSTPGPQQEDAHKHRDAIITKMVAMLRVHNLNDHAHAIEEQFPAPKKASPTTATPPVATPPAASAPTPASTTAQSAETPERYKALLAAFNAYKGANHAFTKGNELHDKVATIGRYVQFSSEGKPTKPEWEPAYKDRAATLSNLATQMKTAAVNSPDLITRAELRTALQELEKHFPESKPKTAVEAVLAQKPPAKPSTIIDEFIRHVDTTIADSTFSNDIGLGFITLPTPGFNPRMTPEEFKASGAKPDITLEDALNAPGATPESVSAELTAALRSHIRRSYPNIPSSNVHEIKVTLNKNDAGIFAQDPDDAEPSSNKFGINNIHVNIPGGLEQIIRNAHSKRVISSLQKLTNEQRESVDAAIAITVQKTIRTLEASLPKATPGNPVTTTVTFDEIVENASAVGSKVLADAIKQYPTRPHYDEGLKPMLRDEVRRAIMQELKLTDLSGADNDKGFSIGVNTDKLRAHLAESASRNRAG